MAVLWLLKNNHGKTMKTTELKKKQKTLSPTNENDLGLFEAISEKKASETTIENKNTEAIFEFVKFYSPNTEKETKVIDTKLLQTKELEYVYFIVKSKPDMLMRYCPQTKELELGYDSIPNPKMEQEFTENKKTIMQAIQKALNLPAKVANIQILHTNPSTNTNKGEKSNHEPKKCQIREIENFDIKKAKFWQKLLDYGIEIKESELRTLIETNYKKTTTEAINIIFKAQNEGYITNTNFPMASSHIYILNLEGICECTSQVKSAA